MTGIGWIVFVGVCSLVVGTRCGRRRNTLSEGPMSHCRRIQLGRRRRPPHTSFPGRSHGRGLRYRTH